MRIAAWDCCKAAKADLNWPIHRWLALQQYSQIDLAEAETSRADVAWDRVRQDAFEEQPVLRCKISFVCKPLGWIRLNS